MPRYVEIGLITLALVIAGTVGAWVSLAVRAQSVGPWAAWVAGQFSVLIWAWQARSNSMSLLSASVLFDVALTGAWFLTYYWLGEVISKTQLLGCACLLLGLVLVNS